MVVPDTIKLSDVIPSDIPSMINVCSLEFKEDFDASDISDVTASALRVISPSKYSGVLMFPEMLTTSIPFTIDLE